MSSRVRERPEAALRPHSWSGVGRQSVPGAATLGDAIAIARSALGVEIEQIAKDDDRPGITAFGRR